MAGITLPGNEITSQDADYPLAPGQIPGEKFSTYLARVHSSWTRGQTRTAKSFAAVTLSEQHTAHATISSNYTDWLDRFIADTTALKKKDKGIVAKLDLAGCLPIHIQPGRITTHTNDLITPQTALAMATLALADPKMTRKGVTLVGNDQEKLLLLHALEQIGFTGKVRNPPSNNTPEYAAAAQLIKDNLPDYIAHIGQKPGTPDTQSAATPIAVKPAIVSP